jgi:hypothetical protein
MRSSLSHTTEKKGSGRTFIFIVVGRQESERTTGNAGPVPRFPFWLSGPKASPQKEKKKITTQNTTKAGIATSQGPFDLS